MQLDGDVIAAYLSSYGGVEDNILITSAHGTAYSDYTFTMILNRGGFHALPHTIIYRDTSMMVVVEGRKPLCSNCKQLGHFSMSYPQKTTIVITLTLTLRNTPLKSITPVKQLLPVTTTAIAEATAAPKDIIQIPINNTAAQKDTIRTPKKKKEKRNNIHRKSSLMK